MSLQTRPSRSTDPATAWRLARVRALRPSARLGLGGSLVALLLLGCNDEAPKPVATPAAAPTVIVAPVERQAVAQSVEFVGRVESLEKVAIRARVTGFLRDRHFEEGQIVRADDLLFTIEREPFEAEVGVKQAKIESAEAALPTGSPDWLRAQDIAFQARAEIERSRKRK